ncbi:MAG: hypothetical protein U0793_24800 [Gemmataceae bacterium]
MMSVLDKLAFYQNRGDEVPNQELAKALAMAKDRKGIREIAENLWHDNPQVQSDCLKVLYEIGYLEPALIGDWVGDFIKLLGSKNNRLVWGSMIALSTVAEAKAAELFEQRGAIQEAMERGSVITIDNGVKTLALIAAGNAARIKVLFPYLLRHLETCRPKEIPQHAEKTSNCSRFFQVLEKRLPELTSAQGARVRRVIKKAQACR